VARPQRINREAILAASLDLADDVGIEQLTMQAVADRLDVTPMALYRYVSDKADLLDGVVERLLGEIELPDPKTPPLEQLAAVGQAIRAVARRHPTVFPLLLQRPATTPAAVQARDRVIALLTEIGVPPREVARCERLISTIILGFAASEAAGRFGRHSRKVIDTDYQLVQSVISRLISDLTT
jgi:AcrR family transcriptional regulator